MAVKHSETCYGLSLGALKSPLRRGWTSAYEGHCGSCPVQGWNRRAFPHPPALWPFSGQLCQFGKAALSHPSLSMTLACGWDPAVVPGMGNEVAVYGWVWTPPMEGHMPPPASDGRCVQPFLLFPERHFPHVFPALTYWGSSHPSGVRSSAGNMMFCIVHQPFPSSGSSSPFSVLCLASLSCMWASSYLS